jgi:hypothetical protein
MGAIILKSRFFCFSKIGFFCVLSREVDTGLLLALMCLQ